MTAFEELNVEVVADEAEIRRAVRRQVRGRAGAISGAILIGGGLGSIGSGAYAIRALPVFALGALAAYLWISRRLSSRAEEVVRLGSVPLRVTIGPGGATFRTKGLRRAISWGGLRLEADAEKICLRDGPASGCPIPRSAFETPDAADRFVAAATAWREAAATSMPTLQPQRLPGGTTREVLYTPTREDQIESALRPAATVLALGSVFLLLQVVAGLLTLPLFVWDHEALAAIAGPTYSLLCLAGLVWLRRAPRRTGRAIDDMRRDWPALGLQRRLAFGPNGVEIDGPFGTGAVAWSRVRSVSEDALRVYIHEGNGVHVVPKAAISDVHSFLAELQRLRARASIVDADPLPK